MTSDHELETLQRGEAAKQLLANDVYNDVVSELQGGYIADWVHAQTPERREELHHLVTALTAIQHTLIERVNLAEQVKLKYEETDDDDEGML